LVTESLFYIPMKTSLKQVPSRQFPRLQSKQAMLCVAVLALTGGAMTARAQAPVQKANSYTSLTTGSDWVGGTAPGANNIAVWDTTAGSPAAEPLGASTTWEGIRIVNPGGAITVNADGNTLTNGAVGVVGLVGIDMSSATHNLTLNNNVAVNGVQNWSVAAGQTLTVNGNLFYTPGSALRIYLPATANVFVTNGVPNSLLGTNVDGAAVVNTNGVAYGTTNGYFATLNDSDYAGLTGTAPSLQVVPASSIPGLYTINQLTGATPTSNGNFVAVNFITNAPSIGWRISGTEFWGAAYLNEPQIFNSTVVWNGVTYPTWQISHSNGRNLVIGSWLLTTNLGNSAMWDNGGGLTRWVAPGGRTQQSLDMRIFQNNPAAPFILANALSTPAAGATLTKTGPGPVSLQANCANLANTVNIYEGLFEVDNGGEFSNSTVNVYGGNLGLAAPNSIVMAQSAITIFSGATNSIILNANNAQVLTSNLTFNAGTTIQFICSNGVAPSTTTAALAVMITNSVLTLNSPINVNILSGSLLPGQFQLIKYTNSIGGTGFPALNLNFLPPHVLGYLSNNTANSSIDLVITNVNEPIAWNTGSGLWDIATTVNWLDASSHPTTYQQALGIGDSVLFSDSAAGGTVTLNTGVTPSSVTVNNANSAYTISGTGSINGTESFTKTGSGTLTLGTTNSFIGGISINGGTVSFSTLGNLGAGNINFGGGTLTYNGNSDDISVRTVNFNAGGATLNTAGQTVTYVKPVGNGGAGGLTKAGAGTLTLTGTNTYHGNTVVSQGTLLLSAATYLTNSATIMVNSGAVLDTAASNVNLTLSGTASQTLAGIGQVNGVVTVPSSTTISPAGNGLTGTLTVNGGLTISGGNINIDLAPTSNDVISVTGPLALNGGNMQLNLIGTVPLGRHVVISYTSGQLSGGIGNIPPPQITQPNTIATLDDSVAGQIAVVLSQSASDVLTWPGTGTTWDVTSSDWLKGASPWIYTNGDTVTFDDSQTGGNVSPSLNVSLLPTLITVSNTVVPVYTFANGGGAIGGNASLVKDGTGTLIMNTPNSYFGTTSIKHGTLQIGNGSQGDIGHGNVTNNGALLFQQGDSSSHFVSGVISGTGSLTVNAAGSAVILTNNNTYSGLTTISNGTLEVGFGGPLGTLGSNNALTNNGTLLINRSGAVSLTANVTGSGTLQSAGSGTVTLSGTLSYLGDSSFSNGIVKLTAANQLPSQTTVPASTGVLNLDNGSTSAGTLDLSGFSLTVNALSGVTNVVNSMITNSSTSTTTTNVITVLLNTGSSTYNGVIVDHGATGAKTMLFLPASTNSLTLNPMTNLITLLPGISTFSGGIVVSNSSLILGTPNSGALVNSSENFLAPGTGPITLLGTNTTLTVNGATASTTPTYGALSNTIVLPAGQTATVFASQRGDINSTLTGAGTLNYVANYVRGGVGGNWAGFTGTINFSGTATGANPGGNIGFGDTNANQIGLANATVVMTSNLQFHAGSLTFPNSTTANYPANTIFPIGALSGGDQTCFIQGNEPGNNNAGAVNVILTIGGLNTSTAYGGGISDNESLTKVGTGTFTLDSGSQYVTNIVTVGLEVVTNIGFESMVISYTGPTIVSNGVLALDAPAIITSSTNVIIASPTAILDASDMGYVSNLTTALPNGQTQELVINGIFEVVSNQSAGGIGTLRGFLQADQGSKLNVGLPTGTFNVSSNASLSGLVNISLDSTDAPTCGELVSPGITVNPTASLVVTNIGPGIGNNTTFTLFNHPVSFASVTLPAKDPTGTSTYIWNNQLAVNGSITLTNGGTLPPSRAIFTSISVNGLALTINATNGAPNGTYRLLQSTNLLVPVGLWTPVLTNTFDANGHLNLTTNVVNPAKPQMYYLLLMP
jgi:autotransporter-associated beta strand protein